MLPSVVQQHGSLPSSFFSGKAGMELGLSPSSVPNKLRSQSMVPAYLPKKIL